MGSCFFIGHRETPDRVYPTLIETIERHIAEYGVSEFVVGQYGNFDRLVIRALSQVKRAHPDITLMLMTPYYPVNRKVDLPKAFDACSIRRIWKRSPNGLPSSAQTDIWWSAAIFSSPMCGIRPATPENCWSMLVREREKEKSTSQIWLRSKSLFQRKQMM